MKYIRERNIWSSNKYLFQNFKQVFASFKKLFVVLRSEWDFETNGNLDYYYFSDKFNIIKFRAILKNVRYINKYR
jgi:hypothetical protein